MAGKQPLLVILGPTASSKSSLAVGIARKLGAEILSVDSMQVYQGMDIGTAKPSLLERHEIPHHLIDWVRPDESFSVARFVELADLKIQSCHERQARLIATGGTPLYYKALFEGLFEGPSADDALRMRLGATTNEQLHERLAAVDPPAALRIHLSDRRRLIRALEVFELTGQTITSLQQEWESQRPHRHPAVWIGMMWEKDELNRRINARVKDMIAAGWVEEVQTLLKQFPNLSKTAGEATGYRELIEHLQGKMSLEDAVEQIKIATRQLARRQIKWFKRFPAVHWLAGNRPIEREHLPDDRTLEFRRFCLDPGIFADLTGIFTARKLSVTLFGPIETLTAKLRLEDFQGGALPGIQIGQLLIEQGALTPRQVDHILKVQKISHRPFGDLAERLYGINPRAIEDAWVEQYIRIAGVVDLDQKNIETEALRTINRRQAWQFHMLPMNRDNDALETATSAKDLVRAVNFSGKKLDEPVYFQIAEAPQLREFLMKHYPVPSCIAQFSETM